MQERYSLAGVYRQDYEYWQRHIEANRQMLATTTNPQLKAEILSNLAYCKDRMNLAKKRCEEVPGQ